MFTRKLVLLGFALTLVFGAAAVKADPTQTDVAWLGVYLESVDKDMAEAFDLAVTDGALVSRVIEDSPADKAGLQEGDIIVKFDGNQVESSDELTGLVRDARPDQEVELTIYRHGRDKQELKVTLAQRQDFERRLSRLDLPRKHDGHYEPATTKRAYLGVNMTDLSEQLGDFFGVKNGEGALITEVDKDSPAAEAEIRAGDVLIAVNGQEIEDPSDVQRLVRDLEPGEKVEIALIRNRSQETLEVELGEIEDDFFGSSFGRLGPDHDLRGMFDLPRSPDGSRTWHFFKQFQGSGDDAWQSEVDKLKDELKALREELNQLKDD